MAAKALRRLGNSFPTLLPLLWFNAFILIYLSGCGGVIQKNRKNVYRPDRPEINLRQEDGNQLKVYGAADLCETGVQLQGPVVYQFLDGERVPVVSNLNRYGNTEGLGGGIVTGAIVDSYIKLPLEAAVDWDLNKIVRPMPAGPLQVVSAGSPLKVCRPGGDYPEDSWEGIALSALQVVDQTTRFVEGVPGLAAIDPLQLLVTPKIVDEIRVTNAREDKPELIRLYQGNNAAYLSGLFEVDSLLLLGELEGERISEAHLWEAPFVVAHEFSHHIFKTLAKASASWRLKSVQDAVLYQHIHGPRFNYVVDPRQGKYSVVMGAWNEGFADLLAWISLGRPKLEGMGIRFLERMRDPASPRLGSVVFKSLTQTRWDAFLSRPVDDEIAGGSGRDTIFSDIHTIGAVLAWGFQVLVTEDRVEHTDKELAAMLIRWVNEVFRSQVDDLGPDEMMKSILSQMVSAVEPTGQLTARQCAAMVATFPAFIKVKNFRLGFAEEPDQALQWSCTDSDSSSNFWSPNPIQQVGMP